jgi:hypothetical protein
MGEEAQLIDSMLQTIAYTCHVVFSGLLNPPPFMCTMTPLSNDLCKLIVHFLTICCNARCSYFSSVCYALMLSHFYQS